MGHYEVHNASSMHRPKQCCEFLVAYHAFVSRSSCLKHPFLDVFSLIPPCRSLDDEVRVQSLKGRKKPDAICARARATTCAFSVASGSEGAVLSYSVAFGHARDASLAVPESGSLK